MTDPVHKIFLMLGQIQSDQETMKKDISEIKATVENYQDNKNKLIGACIGISLLVGGSVSAALNKIGVKL